MRVTFRLTDSPACLVADEHDLSGNLVRMLKAAGQNAPESQADPGNQPGPSAGAAPEVRRRAASTTGPASCSTRRMLAEGGTLDDPAGFVKRLNQMLLQIAK